MKFLALIPARYASTRIPRQTRWPTSRAKPMIRHVTKKRTPFFSDCYVASDDERIVRTVEGFGGQAVMTSAEHRSGIDRCREALDRIEEASTGKRFDAVVNIQGDEPFVAEEQLRLITDVSDDPATEIATLVKAFDAHEDIFNPNSPKVVLSTDGYALYFSRSAIPTCAARSAIGGQRSHKFLKHIGLYAYKRAACCGGSPNYRRARSKTGIARTTPLARKRLPASKRRKRIRKAWRSTRPTTLKAAVEFLRRSEK